MQKEEIGLIGFGTVGTGVVQGLYMNREQISSHNGLQFHIKRIVDIDTTTDRGVDTGDAIISDDYKTIVNDEDITIVVQLIGGTEFAFDLMLELIKAGKKIVTANKALLAERGPELFAAARENNTTIAFEASTAGGIPILEVMRDGLAGNQIESFYGIVNGTCNYILTQMTDQDLSYETALQIASEKGYAEADPTFDVEGFDAAHKLVILAATGFHKVISMQDIHVEGITQIDQTDITFARELGYAVKLLAIGIRREEGLELRVHPALVPEGHPLASVNGVFNAICLNSNLVGETMYYGRGAGSLPTASAVIADIIDTAIGGYDQRFANLCYFQKDPQSAAVLPFNETVSRFYIRITVKDIPGVLAKVTSILNNHDISVASMLQKESIEGQTGIEMMTHNCSEKHFQEAINEFAQLDFVIGKPSFIRAIDMGFNG